MLCVWTFQLLFVICALMTDRTELKSRNLSALTFRMTGMLLLSSLRMNPGEAGEQKIQKGEGEEEDESEDAEGGVKVEEARNPVPTMIMAPGAAVEVERGDQALGETMTGIMTGIEVREMVGVGVVSAKAAKIILLFGVGRRPGCRTRSLLRIMLTGAVEGTENTAQQLAGVRGRIRNVVGAAAVAVVVGRPLGALLHSLLVHPFLDSLSRPGTRQRD